MLSVHFQPRLLEAECEFWFQSAAEPFPTVEPQIAARLAQRLPSEGEISLPWLWYEANYLAVRSEGLSGGVAAHQHRMLTALNVYLEAAQPQAVQSVFLRYLFSVPADAVSADSGLPVRQTSHSRLSVAVADEESSWPPRVEVEVRCLHTRGSRRAVTDPPGWLDDLHDLLEAEFQRLRCKPTPVRRRL